MSDLDYEYVEDGRPAGDELRRAFRKGVAVGCGIAVAVLAGLVLALLITLGVLMSTGHVPDTAAVPGSELHASTLELLREEGLLEEGEEVLYFYSDGFLSAREDGNFFTDRKVVSYWEQGDELYVEMATYPEIADIVPELSDGLLENSEVRIERREGDSFVLLVSNEEDLDEAFVELLVATWEGGR